MPTIEELLSCYENADINQRLHLYLQYRDLRRWFFEKENVVTEEEKKNEGNR